MYERAVSNVPPVAEKSYWRRYIYLWINYALFEELDARDVERARQVYRYGRCSAGSTLAREGRVRVRHPLLSMCPVRVLLLFCMHGCRERGCSKECTSLVCSRVSMPFCDGVSRVQGRTSHHSQCIVHLFKDLDASS